ncbi:MAG TPA: hypothetical protein VGH51_04465 [Candidatus Angelobacter sp.]|jgi:hypothetical protein
MRQPRPELNRKLVSLLLIVGGIAGVAIALWSELQFLQTQAAANRAAALMDAFALIFGACTWTGVELWRKKPAAYRWAQILLIAQIPNISFAGFAYYFYTGFTLYLSLNTMPSVLMGFQFELGSAMKIAISSEIEGFTFGLNLAAIAALYLLGKSRTTAERE